MTFDELKEEFKKQFPDNCEKDFDKSTSLHMDYLDGVGYFYYNVYKLANGVESTIMVSGRFGENLIDVLGLNDIKNRSNTYDFIYRNFLKDKFEKFGCREEDVATVNYNKEFKEFTVMLSMDAE